MLLGLYTWIVGGWLHGPRKTSPCGPQGYASITSLEPRLTEHQIYHPDEARVFDGLCLLPGRTHSYQYRVPACPCVDLSRAASVQPDRRGTPNAGDPRLTCCRSLPSRLWECLATGECACCSLARFAPGATELTYLSLKCRSWRACFGHWCIQLCRRLSSTSLPRVLETTMVWWVYPCRILTCIFEGPLVVSFFLRQSGLLVTIFAAGRNMLRVSLATNTLTPRPDTLLSLINDV
jgi:hypothetical protein